MAGAGPSTDSHVVHQRHDRLLLGGVAHFRHLLLCFNVRGHEHLNMLVDRGGVLMESEAHGLTVSDQ
jgi:hypothetical protein